MSKSVSRELEAEGKGGVALRGSISGEGRPLLLAHGLTAHRDLVVHGSSYLPRHGFELATYDARGHGDSDGGAEGSYGYETLVADLRAFAEQAFATDQKPLLAGHSMGAHTILAAALENPGAWAGLVVIGPVSLGEQPSSGSLAYWDRLADGLAADGVEGWLEAYDVDLDPEWRQTLLRIARERLSHHRHPQALAQALREVPRSVPYEGLAALAAIELPTLVVASHDRADPGHPFETAERIAETLPNARLLSEADADESPLAWQGGKLSRAIASFAEDVA